jgi:large subunit ribosomal protein L21e
MVQKSHGARSASRGKMILKRKATITDHLREFEEGQIVHLVFQPDIPNKGYPHLMFYGKTGRVVGKRGKAYVVEFRDKSATKKVIVKSVHLRPEIEASPEKQTL